MIDETADLITSWLGENSKVITNKAGDKVFLSEDGLRKVRFDINKTRGDKPHMQIEILKDGEWIDATDLHHIYPEQ